MLTDEEISELVALYFGLESKKSNFILEESSVLSEFGQNNINYE